MPVNNETKIATIKSLASGKEDAFPKEVLAPIWQQAFKGSVVQQISGTTPVSMRGNAVPVPVGQPVAGIVTESGDKPVAELQTKVKTFSPVKAAIIVVASKEAEMANPVGAFDNLQKQMAEGISRCIDTAVIHGKDALTGNPLAGHEALAQTTKDVELDLGSTKSGYFTAQLGSAYDQVVNADNADEADYDLTRWLLSPKVRVPFISAVDAMGRPLYQGSPDLTDQASSILGIPATFSKAVHGYGAVKEPSVLGYGGDFGENLKLGFVENITWSQASEYAAGIDLFGRNLHAYLAEVIFAWIIRDKDAFVKLHAKAGARTP